MLKPMLTRIKNRIRYTKDSIKMPSSQHKNRSPCRKDKKNIRIINYWIGILTNR